MFNFVRFTLFICLCVVLIVLSSTVTGFLAHSSAEPQVAFAFTPVPTATRQSAAAFGDPEFQAGQFSIEIETVSEAVSADVSAETTPPSTQPTLAPVRAASQRNSTEGKRVAIVERAVLETNVNRSRVTIANIAYAINIAKGTGSLSCLDLINNYETLAAYEQFGVSAELQLAYDHYVRAINVVVIGVNPLFQYCQQLQAESPYRPEIAIRRIQPAQIWNQAVTESNLGIALTTDAAGWLNGSPRLLDSLYEQLDAALELYSAALDTPTIESCAALRQAFEPIAFNATHLDLGDNSVYFSSYDKYSRAIEATVQSGQALYEYCDPRVGGLGQLNDNVLQLLPMGPVAAAQNGLLDAQKLIDLAHFYIAPPAPENEN